MSNLGDLSNLKVDTSNEANQAISGPDLKTQQYISDQLSDVKDKFTVNFITIFGIFVSFLGFFAFEIQILKSVSDFWLLLGLSSFLLGGMLAFSYSLVNLAKDKMTWEGLWNPITMFIGIFLLISLISFSTYSYKQDKRMRHHSASFIQMLDSDYAK